MVPASEGVAPASEGAAPASEGVAHAVAVPRAGLSREWRLLSAIMVGGRLHLAGGEDDLREAQQAHDYAWTVLEGILPYSSQVHKRHGQRSQAAARSDYDELDELMRQSERAMKELEETLTPTQEEDNIKAVTRRRMPGAPFTSAIESRYCCTTNSTSCR